MVWEVITLDLMTTSHGLCRLIAYSHHVIRHCGLWKGSTKYR